MYVSQERQKFAMTFGGGLVHIYTLHCRRATTDKYDTGKNSFLIRSKIRHPAMTLVHACVLLAHVPISFCVSGTHRIQHEELVGKNLEGLGFLSGACLKHEKWLPQ